MENNDALELTVVREEPEPCHVKLDIEVPQKRVKRVFDDVVKAFRKSAAVPGFRKGKTPRQLLLKRYAKDIEEEAKTRLFREVSREAWEKEDLVPETTPRIENEEMITFSPDTVFTFAITFDIAPDFELPDYTSVTVSEESTDIGEDSVQEVIDGWLQQRASYETVDRPAEEGDVLKVSYKGRLLDAEDEPPETARFLLEAE